MDTHLSATKSTPLPSHLGKSFALNVLLWSSFVFLMFSSSTVSAVMVGHPSVFTSQLSLPSGITTDNNGNVFILSDAVTTTLLTKFAPNGTVLGQTSIGSVLDLLAGSRLASDPITGSIVMLTPDGRLIEINPQTLATTLFLDIKFLPVDTGNVYDVLNRRFAPFVLSPQSAYGDVALFRPGNDPNRLDLFVTGISVSHPFVMRLSINFQAQSVAAKVTLTSLGTTAGDVNLPRGIAVNTQGVGLTTLPVGFTSVPNTGFFDQVVTFDARFPASGVSSPQVLFPTQDIASRGMSVDAAGNFYIATGVVGASACQSSGPLVVIPQTLNTFQCFPLVNGPLVRSEDVVITQGTGVGYMTYLTPNVVLTFPTSSPNQPDLIATGLALPTTSWQVGVTITADLTEQNTGNASADSHVSQLYLSSDNVITTNDTPLGSPLNYTTIAAGATQTQSKTFTVPPMPNGTYYIGVIVDINNSVVESNENNVFVRNGTITVAPGQAPPQIAISPRSFAVTLTKGESTTRTLTITNNGTGVLNWSIGVNTIGGAISSSVSLDDEERMGVSLSSPRPYETFPLTAAFTNLDSLSLRAEQEGSVRVIVGLRSGFQPEAKLSTMAATQQRQDIAAKRESLLQALSGYNVSSIKRFESIPYVAMRVDAAALQRLLAHPDVKSVHEDIPVPPALAESMPLIGAVDAAAGGYSGAGQIVAILDSGVDSVHPFLTGKVASEACYSTTDATQGATTVCPNGTGSQIGTGAGAPCNANISGCNHGTHVAGIIAGSGGSFSGVAETAGIIAIQVFSRFVDPVCAQVGRPSPCALSFISDQLRGLERVYTLRALYNIAAVNMSLGGGRFSLPCDGEPHKAIIDNLRAANIATVIASGNSGFTDALGSPACISTAISVGSTQDGSGGTTVDQVSSFSNSASFLTLLAPGQLINSSVPGGGFTNLQGTSMAAPHVSGAWAILKSKAPAATVDEIRAALVSTGIAVADSRNGITKPRIQIDAALNALETNTWLTTTPLSGSVPAGGSTTVRLSIVTANLTPGAYNGTLAITANDPDTSTVTVPVNLEVTPSQPSPKTLSIGNASQMEGNVGASNLVFTVTLSGPSTNTVTVNYVTANGTAMAGSDYTAVSGALTFTPGQTSKTIAVAVKGDTTVEPNETFTVQLRGAVGAMISNGQGVGTILNDDTTALRISDVKQGEGNSGASNFVFTVSLSNPSASPVTVNYATVDGSAKAGSDYTAKNGTLTFTAGQTSKTIAVAVKGDTTVEPNEAFRVNLSHPTGATLADRQGVGTILNDDTAKLRITDVSKAEGNVGAAAFTFTVTSSNPNANTMTVHYATANGTARAVNDYTATNGALTFKPGETSKMVTVNVKGDTMVEPNETFFVNLNSPNGATIADGQGRGTILNDDGPLLRITDVRKVEGNAGTTTFPFTLTLSPANANNVKVNYATANRTATAGSDYTAISGSLIFTLGQTSKIITVNVTGDTTLEPNETFVVNLTDATGATLFKRQGVGTIVNDD